MKKFLAVLFGLLAVGVAFAAGENVPTSKSFVDAAVAQKQDIIPKSDGATQVLTNTGVAGEYDTRGIYDATGEYAAQAQNLVDAATMNAGVQNAIDSEFQCIEWDEHGECLLLSIFGAPQQQILPREYTQLEYLESNGTQYIDTGYTYQNNTTAKVIIDTMFTDLIQPYNYHGVSGSAYGGPNVGLYRYGPVFAGAASGDFFTRTHAELNTKYRFILDVPNQRFMVLDPLTDTILVTKEDFSIEYRETRKPSFFLFGYRVGALNASRIYSAVLYDSGQMVRNFIPARRNSDGVLGMYDTVTNTFFTNNGTGEFIAGPIVYLPHGE